MAVFSVATLYAEQQVSQEQNVVLVADVDALIHPVSAEYIAPVSYTHLTLPTIYSV